MIDPASVLLKWWLGTPQVCFGEHDGAIETHSTIPRSNATEEQRQS